MFSVRHVRLSASEFSPEHLWLEDASFLFGARTRPIYLSGVYTRWLPSGARVFVGFHIQKFPKTLRCYRPSGIQLP